MLFAQSCLTLRPMDWDCQAFLFMISSRQEYWSGLPFSYSRGFSRPGMEPSSPVLAGGFFTAEPSGKPHLVTTLEFKTCILDLLGSPLKFYLYHFQQCMNFTMIRLHLLLLLHLYHCCHVFSVCIHLFAHIFTVSSAVSFFFSWFRLGSLSFYCKYSF